jgi:hypothetical protein
MVNHHLVLEIPSIFLFTRNLYSNISNFLHLPQTSLLGQLKPFHKNNKMSQHPTPSGSKTTKPTHKDTTPSMDFLDEDILDVIPLSVIPGEATDSTHPMDASATACPTRGNSSNVPSSATHTPSSKDDMHHIDRVIRNLVTRILNEGHSVKGVSTPLSRRDPSPEVGPHNEKDDDSSRSEKDMAAEGL